MAKSKAPAKAAKGGGKAIRHLYLIDGSGYLFRAYHALPPMSRPDGTPVNAVFGFCRMLVADLLDNDDVDHIAMILDAGRTTFRNEIYDKYKANRPDPPEDLIPQFPLIREAAKAFNERLAVTGIVLTRVDGDGRGGAALSMRAVTGKPIKLIGTGERMDALEDFHPARIADRILGMGDIVSLVEKAAANIDREQAMRAAEKMRKGAFDLSDLRDQLTQMQKLGGIGGLMGMMPGIAKLKNQMAERNLDDSLLKRQMAIIDSMTPGERKHPDILKASRKKRIAAGSGTKVEEINKLLKMHRGMADMMKAMSSGKRGPMAGLAQMMGFGGGMPSAEDMAKMAQQMPGGGAGLPPNMPGGAGGLPKFPGAPGLPGLPGLGKFPGLGGPPPGLPGLGKKK